MDFKILFNCRLQLSGAPIYPSSQLLFSDSGEPAFDQIDPGCSRRSKMQMVSRSLREPSANRGRFMRSVVVQNQMNVQINRNSHLYSVQKLSKFKGPMSPMTLPDDLSRFHVEGGEERSGSMARVIMCSPLHLAWPHGQKWLRSVERLNLRLLVHAQHQSSIRRGQIQPHNVSHLFDKKRIFGQLKRLGPMGLQTECPPDPTDGALTQPAFLGHGASTPMRSAPRGGFQGSGNHTLHVGIHNLPGSPGPRLIKQAIQAMAGKPRPPFSHGLWGYPEGYRH